MIHRGHKLALLTAGNVLLIWAVALARQPRTSIVRLHEEDSLDIKQAVAGASCGGPIIAASLKQFDISPDGQYIAAMCRVEDAQHLVNGWPLSFWEAALVNRKTAMLIGLLGRTPDRGRNSLEFRESHAELLRTENGNFELYDPRALGLLYRLTARELERDQQFSLSFYGAALSPNGRYLVGVYYEHLIPARGTELQQRPRLEQPMLYVVDLDRREVVSHCTPDIKSNDAISIGVNSEGNRVAYERGEPDQPNVEVLDSSTCGVLWTRSFSEPPNRVAVLPDGHHFIVTFGWGGIQAEEVSLDDGTTVFQIPNSGKKGFDRAMAVSHDGRWLALGSGSQPFSWTENWTIKNPGVNIWDLLGRHLVGALQIGKTFINETGVSEIEFTPDDQTVVVETPDCKLHDYAWHVPH